MVSRKIKVLQVYDHEATHDNPAYEYVVKSATNLTHPRIGDRLSEERVQMLIGSGVTVDVTATG